MAPYANCGSKAQSIDASTDMSSIVGTCGAQKGNSTSIPIGNSSDVNNGNKKKDSGASSVSLAWNCFGLMGAFAIAALAL